MTGTLEVYRPTSVEEAAGLRERLGDDTHFLAGGTELLLLKKLGLTDLGRLVNLKYIPELHALHVDDAGNLVIGAAVTHQELADSPLVRDLVPEFARVEGQLANLRVRVSGTLAGNLAFADPHSDPATFLTATGATLHCVSAGGVERDIPVEGLIQGIYETVLEPGEVIATITLPAARLGDHVSHHRFESQRHRPAVTVTAAVDLDDRGTIRGVRLAAGSLCPRPIRLADTESMLLGVPAEAVDRPLIQRAASEASHEIHTHDDPDGSADFKRQLLYTLLGRAIAEATSSATGARLN